MNNHEAVPTFDCIVVGGGYTGIAASLKLAKTGLRVLLLEKDKALGGLAGSFLFSDGVRLEKFYHHWFRSDHHLFELLEELGLLSLVKWAPSRTGSFLNSRIWRLSTPLDLIRFTELSLLERLRLGFAILFARTIRNYRKIEGKSIREWLVPLVGDKVFDVVWKPLIDAKFGKYAEEVSAAWMWKKLILRGGSRKADGSEQLAYFEGGFGLLTDLLLKALESNGVDVRLSQTVESLKGNGLKIHQVQTDRALFSCDSLILATPQPITVELLRKSTGSISEHQSLLAIPHLANVCLVMRLSKSLSDAYWLNVTDPGFPFVGVIEHTNLDLSDSYGGSHVVYLSRYLDTEDVAWKMSDEEYFEYCLPYLKKMFPDFSRSWVIGWRTWHAQYAQPVTMRNYSLSVPSFETYFENVFQANMAQIYPEDRGTNYAVRGGSKVASLVLGWLKVQPK